MLLAFQGIRGEDCGWKWPYQFCCHQSQSKLTKNVVLIRRCENKNVVLKFWTLFRKSVFFLDFEITSIKVFTTFGHQKSVNFDYCEIWRGCKQHFSPLQLWKILFPTDKELNCRIYWILHYSIFEGAQDNLFWCIINKINIMNTRNRGLQSQLWWFH